MTPSKKPTREDNISRMLEVAMSMITFILGTWIENIAYGFLMAMIVLLVIRSDKQ